MSPKEHDSSQKVTRRDFLKLLASSVEVLEKGFMAYELSRLGIEIADWGMEVPNIQTISNETVLPGNPHWPEAAYSDRPIFINPNNKGHKDLLVYLSTHDPLLKKMHELAFKDLFFNEPKQRIGLHDSFSRHIGYAKKALRNTNARPIDHVHAAMFTFASVNSNFYSIGDVYHSFGVWDYVHPEFDSILIDIGLYKQNIPKVFPEITDDPKNGVDKIMHFAGFAFLAFEKWYTTINDLPDGKRIPRFAELFSSIASDPKINSEILAFSGEFAWELDETHTWLKNMKEQKKFLQPNTGLFEIPGLEYDMLASYMGAHFAMKLADEDITMAEVENIVHILDNPDQLWPQLPINMRNIQMGMPKIDASVNL